MIWFKKRTRERNDFEFCEDQKLIKAFMSKLSAIKTEEELEGKLFADIRSGKKWEVYEFDDFETYREPYPLGIRPYPHPNLERLVDLLCKTEYKDEIQGICRLLLEKEHMGIEFRKFLLDQLELRSVIKDKKKYRVIYDAANLSDKSNQRDVLNKSLVEVETDHLYYIEIANRAEKLLK